MWYMIVKHLGCIVNLFRDKIKLKPGVSKKQGDVALLLAHYQGINLIHYVLASRYLVAG